MSNIESKIIPFEKAAQFFEELRKRKKQQTVALCHGCFDIVHPGHIRHLKFAREQGTFLVVSITPDSCIQKGSFRPYVPQDLRAENLAALEIVSAVIIAPGDTGAEPIEAVKPDIYVKGSEYALSRDPRFIREKELIESLGGKVLFSSGDVVFSSSELIRERELDTAASEKLSYICLRHGVSRAMIEGIISAAPGKKFLIAGEPVIDEYHYCDRIGVSQEAPALSLSMKYKRQYIAGSGSLAMHLALMGAQVTLISSFNPETQAAETLTKTLTDNNIRLLNTADAKRPVVMKSLYYVDKNQVMEVESGSYFTLDSTLRSAIIKQFKKELKNDPDCVILGDYGYGLISDDLAGEMIHLANTKGVISLSDISMTLRTRLEKFYGSEALAATELELRSCMHDYENGLSVLVERFYRMSRIKELYMLLGDGSAIYFKRPKGGSANMETAHIPQLLHREEDKRGRTEAFAAGVALAKVSRANEVQCMYLGAAMAAIHSRNIGNKPVSKEDLIRFLDEKKELAAAPAKNTQPTGIQ